MRRTLFVFREDQCEEHSVDATLLPSTPASAAPGTKWRKSMKEARASPWALACSRCDSLLGVVEPVVQMCSEWVHEDVPFCDNFVEYKSGLPVQLYRAFRDKDGSAVTRTPGHQKKNWVKPRRNLRCTMLVVLVVRSRTISDNL